MEIIDKKNKYYYTGELKKGTVLSTEKRFGDKESEINAYQVAKYGRKYFLLNDIEPLEKGIIVNTKIGEGELIEIGKELCAVKVQDKISTFKINEIEKKIDPLEAYTKSLENFHSLEDDIKYFNKVYNTTYLKSLIDNIEGGKEIPKAEMPKNIIKTAMEPAEDFTKTPELPKAETPETFGAKSEDIKESTEEPKVLGTKIPKENPPIKNLYNNIKSKISGLFTPKKSLTPTAPPEAPKTKVYDFDTQNEIGDLANIKENKSGNHLLTHISLNPNATSPENKSIFHYKVGGDFKKFNYPVDEKGEKLTNLPSHLQGRTYYPGEHVSINNQEFKVKSHVSPFGDVPDYNKMLVEDKEGKTFAVPREKVQPLHPQASHPLTLENGTNKFHHELKNGDIILKNGERHEVIGTSSKGHLTFNHNTGGLYWQDAQDYDKPFRHNDYRFKEIPEEGDEITFLHNGTMKTRPVVKGTENGSAVVQVNKSDLPIEVPKGQFAYTGRTANKPYTPPTPKANEAHTSNEEIKPIDEIIDKLKDTDEFSKNAFNKKVENLNSIVKPHNIQKTNENSYRHKLGIGDLAIKTEFDPVSKETKQEIQNPYVTMGNKKYKVLGYDDENKKLQMKEIPKSLKETKPFSVPIDEAKDIIRNNENIPNPGFNDFSEEKNTLISDIANNLYDKGIKDVKDLDISKHAKDLESGLLHYTNKMNEFNRGTATVEPETYKPVKFDLQKEGNKILEKEIGSDWKDKLQNKINNIEQSKIKEAQDLETDKKNKEIRDKIEKANLEKIDQTKQAIQENIKNNPKDNARLDYQGINEKMPEVNKTEGKDTKLFFPESQYKDTPAKFTLVNAYDLQTSHIPSGSVNEPYQKNPNFPPNSQQRAYDTPIGTPEGEKNRKANLQKVKEFNPQIVFNDNPEAANNAPVVDKHGFVMGGNDRTMAYQQLSPEKLKESADYIKENLDRFFDFKTPEEKENMKKQIDDMVEKGQRPMIARMVDMKYHENPEKYEALTTELNASPQKKLSRDEAVQGIMNKIPNERIKDLYDISEGKKIESTFGNKEKTSKYLDWLKGVMNDTEFKTMYDNQGNLTDEAKGLLKGVYAQHYITDENVNKKLNTLSNAKEIRNTLANNSHLLNDLKSTAYDLRQDIGNVIGKVHSGAQTKENNGQERAIPESNTTKALEQILTGNMGDDQKNAIIEDYYNKAKQWHNQADQFNMFGNLSPEEEKENYFGNLIKNNYRVAGLPTEEEQQYAAKKGLKQEGNKPEYQNGNEVGKTAETGNSNSIVESGKIQEKVSVPSEEEGGENKISPPSSLNKVPEEPTSATQPVQEGTAPTTKPVQEGTAPATQPVKEETTPTTKPISEKQPQKIESGKATTPPEEESGNLFGIKGLEQKGEKNQETNIRQQEMKNAEIKKYENFDTVQKVEDKKKDYKGIHPDNIMHFNQGKNERATLIVPSEDKYYMGGISAREKAKDPKLKKEEKDELMWQYNNRVDALSKKENISKDEAVKKLDDLDKHYKDIVNKYKDPENPTLINTFKIPKPDQEENKLANEPTNQPKLTNIKKVQTEDKSKASKMNNISSKGGTQTSFMKEGAKSNAPLLDNSKKKILTDKLETSFPGYKGKINMYDDEKEYKNKLKDIGYNENNTPLGFVDKDGQVHINSSKVTSETPAHEVLGHVWLNDLKQNDPDTYNKGLELIKQSPEVYDKVKELYPELYEKNEELFNQEALAWAIGAEGSKQFEQWHNARNTPESKTLWGKFKTWYRDLYIYQKYLQLSFREYFLHLQDLFLACLYTYC